MKVIYNGEIVGEFCGLTSDGCFYLAKGYGRQVHKFDINLCIISCDDYKRHEVQA